MPDLDSSPERLTSTSAGIVRRRAADSLESEWQSSQQLVDRLRLAALEVADEVPAEGVAVERVLALEVLGLVLADDLDPGLGEDAELVGVDVLRRGHDRHVRPELGSDPIDVRADRLSR